MFGRKGMFSVVALPALALGMTGLGVAHIRTATPDLGPTEPPASPARTPFDGGVAAAGLVEARGENIAVGAAISGVVLEVFVPCDRAGVRVEAGAPLFRVDDRHLRAELAAAEARRDAARERLARLEAMPRPEEIPPSEARVQAAEQAARLALDKLERTRQLVRREAASQELLVERELEHRAAVWEHERTRRDHALLLAGAWAPDLAIAHAELSQAGAEVDRLATEVERALVRAPVDAEVLRVDVRPGERVDARPGAALMVLGDTSALHVRADVDEEDIPRLRLSTATPARAFARGDADRPIPLRFVRVEPLVRPKLMLTGEGAERVDTRVLQVILAVEPGSEAGGLRVGQQVDVFLGAPAVGSNRP